MLKRRNVVDTGVIFVFSIGEIILLHVSQRGPTKDSGHRQDEQLQQCVLLLIGQTQEAQFGHFGEVRDSTPYYL